MGDLTKNLSLNEFACKCPWHCGFGLNLGDIDLELPQMVQAIRDFVSRSLGKDSPVIISSGCRCVRWNRDPRVGGTEGSNHTQGRAADLVFPGVSARIIGKLILLAYNKDLLPQLGGLGIYSHPPGKYDFCHVDTQRVGNRLRRW